MTRAAAGRALRRGLVGLAVTVTLVLVFGWVGAKAIFPMHMRYATGRSDVSLRKCTFCHRDVEAPATRGAGPGDGYLSPTGLAVSPDGARLYVAAFDADRLLEVDLATASVSRSVAVPGGPHGVSVSHDGGRVAVSSRDGDRVRVFDAVGLGLLTEMPALEPLDVTFAAAGDSLWVASAFGDEVVHGMTDAEGDQVHLSAGNEPYALALAPDAGLLAVANRLARPVGPNEMPASELTIVDARRRRVLERRELRSAHLSEGVALAADGSFALATAIRVRNLLPLTQVARGAVMTSAVVYADLSPGGATIQFPLDDVNAYFGDPSGIVLSRDGQTAYVAHGGADTVSAIDVTALRAIASEADDAARAALADDLGIAGDYVLARIPTLANPRTLALSPDGARLYVAQRLADSIAVIDTRELRVIGQIDLGGRRDLDERRRGARVFHDASVTFQGQFSCRSCHPDGHTDGLIWDFEIDGLGRNLLETRSLRGIRDTAPFKWNGKNPSLHVQCGPRFARVLTRSDPFPPERLDDLVSFIESLRLPPRRLDDGLEEARRRGEAIFVREVDNAGVEIPKVQRCVTCHRPPLLTDRLKADVGTGGEFDTPHLFDIGSSQPYLHDGRAMTLEEIWTVYSPDDTHGRASDLDKVQLNDLVVYLRSL